MRKLIFSTILICAPSKQSGTRMSVQAIAGSELEKTEARLAEELIALLQSDGYREGDLERLQIKLNMVHETQTQAGHLTYEDLKHDRLVKAVEVVKGKAKRRPRTMRIGFEEMPVVWPLGVKERFIRRMIEYDHVNGDFILKFFGEGIIEASGVRLILERTDAEHIRKVYIKHANELALSLDLTVVQ